MSQIEPATHEAKGHLYYTVDGLESGLEPYWTVGSLLINEFDGHFEQKTTIDDEPVTLELTYSKSGIAPRPQDDVQDRLYEFELHIAGYDERKCHYNLSPRFPGMSHWESGDTITTPFDHLEPDNGVSIQFQSSNFALDEIPQLLPTALEKIADHAGTGFDSRYFDRPLGGRIAEVERYVRILRDENKKLIRKGGLFDRLAMLLSTEEGTRGEYKWDNEEVLGHFHKVEIGPVGATELAPDHSVGRQLKSYLPEHPENFDEDDALYHPKFGVLFRQSLNKESWSWSRRDDLIQELDETIINSLHWSEIPIESSSAFVADDHFSVDSRDQDVPLFDDPTPRIEAEQDHLLMTTLRDMTTSDMEIVETLATDGGKSTENLAEDAGYSLSTIYRALQRLDGLLESRKGHVKFASQKIAEDIRGIIENTERRIESAADRVAELFDYDVVQKGNSAVERWLAEYGAEFEQPDGDEEAPTVRIDTVMSEIKSSCHPNLDEALDYLYHAWISDGRKRAYDIEDVIIDAQLDTGEHYKCPMRALR